MPIAAPAIGDKAPVTPVKTLEGRPYLIGGPAQGPAIADVRFGLLPDVQEPLPVAKSFAAAERVSLVFVGDDDPAAQRGAGSPKHDLAAFPFINSDVVGGCSRWTSCPTPCCSMQRHRAGQGAGQNSREHFRKPDHQPRDGRAQRGRIILPACRPRWMREGEMGMKRFDIDGLGEKLLRKFAGNSSRRSFLTKLGGHDRGLRRPSRCCRSAGPAPPPRIVRPRPRPPLPATPRPRMTPSAITGATAPLMAACAPAAAAA